MKSQVKPTS